MQNKLKEKYKMNTIKSKLSSWITINRASIIKFNKYIQKALYIIVIK